MPKLPKMSEVPEMHEMPKMPKLPKLPIPAAQILLVSQIHGGQLTLCSWLNLYWSHLDLAKLCSTIGIIGSKVIDQFRACSVFGQWTVGH